MILYDFKCSSCGNVFERLACMDDKECECSCGAKAQRLIATPNIALDGASGEFPGAAMKWDKLHNKKAYEKQEKSLRHREF